MSSPQLKKNVVALDRTGRDVTLLEGLFSRRSVSPKRMVGPGPDEGELRQIVAAAVTAPDHCALRPWRFIHIHSDALGLLGDVFAEIKARRDPTCSAEALERERARAHAAPVLIAVVARVTVGHPRVRVCEQFMSAGAAMQNMLLCAHALGYGAKIVSGLKVLDPQLAHALNIAADEQLAGFVCLGTQAHAPRKAARPDIDDHLTVWNPRNV